MAGADAGLSLHDARVLLILEAGDAASILSRARAALGAGVWALEVDTSGGTEALSALVRERLPCVPGAGGVRDAGGAWAAVEAGARFVAGTLDGEIAAVCEAAGVGTIAEVGAVQEARDALPLRTDFIRLRAGLELPPGGAAGAALIRELAADTADGAPLSTSDGASMIAVRETMLDPTSPEDLGRKLEALRDTVERDQE